MRSLNCEDILLKLDFKNPEYKETGNFSLKEYVMELENKFVTEMINNGMTVTESDLAPPGCFDMFFDFPFNSHYCNIGW